ncbi:MAG: DUF177 domain-containing protein [Nitrospinota bacterium]
MSSLTVALADIAEEGLALDVEEEATALKWTFGEFPVVGPVRVRGQLERSRGGVALRGAVSAAIELICSRCLRPFRQRVEQEFQVQFLPRPPGPPEAAKEINAEEPDEAYIEGETLDVGVVARDHLGLALPMKPLCREDCPGLCPRCGKDLNEGPCGCAAEGADPRLAALAELLRGPRS